MTDTNNASPWHTLSAEEVLAKQQSATSGLSDEEAAKRLASMK